MPGYEISFTSSAAREFRKLSARIRERIAPAIDSLKSNPRPREVEKLKGRDHFYRIPVGQYRVVYEIDDKAKKILVTRMRHRREVYR